jgi:cyclopropane fatty-acyl-phospholipid synthase-like methyltransferase
MPAVPSDHRFDDPDYVRDWADGINERRPSRAAVFARMAAELSAARVAPIRVLELGSGPGMLAEQLLGAVDAIGEYTLFDFSEPMHELARRRLAAHTARCRHVEGSFLTEHWPSLLHPRYDAVVSLQAVHELRDAALIPLLYRRAREELLTAGGVVLVADMVNLAGSAAGHLLTVDGHAAAFLEAGFADVEVLEVHDDLALWRAVAPTDDV